MIVNRASTAFSGTTAWQNQPRVERNTDMLVDVEQEGWVELDITSYVESWQAGAPNYGIVLVPVNTNNKFNMFVSGNDGERQKFWPNLVINR
jgi:hypothetical protein